MTQTARETAFAALHVPGDPVVLFNIWDAGSAAAVGKAGAKALATGSASVAGAQGFADGEDVPLDLVFANLERITHLTDLPVTLDFEGGYAVDADQVAANAQRARDAGAVGINFEDQVVGGEGLHPADVQGKRIEAIRQATGDTFWINARTDLFLKAAPDSHDRALLDEALERGRAYAGAGASSLFLPGLADPDLIKHACAHSPLPVNIMAMPTTPPRADMAELGVARISHGPFPWRNAMKALANAAKDAMS